MKLNEVKFLPATNAVADAYTKATGVPFVGEMMAAAAGNGGNELKLESVTIKVEANAVTGDAMVVAYAKFNKELSFTDTGAFNFAYNEKENNAKGQAQYYGNFSMGGVDGDTATYIAESDVFVDKYNAAINPSDYDFVTCELSITQDDYYRFNDFSFTYETFTLSNVVVTKVAEAVDGVSDAEYTVTADSNVDMSGYHTIYLYSETTGDDPQPSFEITLVYDENDHTKLVLNTEAENVFNEEFITNAGGIYEATNEPNDYVCTGNWTYAEDIQTPNEAR